MSTKVIPNEHNQEPKGKGKHSSIDDAIGQIFPGRNFNEQQMGELRKFVANMLRKNAQNNHVQLKDAILTGFKTYQQITKALLEQLAENPEEYAALNQEALLSQTFADVNLVNASEAEMIRTLAKRKLEAAKQSSPDNKLNLGQKVTPKKPRPR